MRKAVRFNYHIKEIYEAYIHIISNSTSMKIVEKVYDHAVWKQRSPLILHHLALEAIDGGCYTREGAGLLDTVLTKTESDEIIDDDDDEEDSIESDLDDTEARDPPPHIEKDASLTTATMTPSAGSTNETLLAKAQGETASPDVTQFLKASKHQHFDNECSKTSAAATKASDRFVVTLPMSEIDKKEKLLPVINKEDTNEQDDPLLARLKPTSHKAKSEINCVSNNVINMAKEAAAAKWRIAREKYLAKHSNLSSSEENGNNDSNDNHCSKPQNSAAAAIASILSCDNHDKETEMPPYVIDQPFSDDSDEEETSSIDDDKSPCLEETKFLQQQPSKKSSDKEDSNDKTVAEPISKTRRKDPPGSISNPLARDKAVSKGDQRLVDVVKQSPPPGSISNPLARDKVMSKSDQRLVDIVKRSLKRSALEESSNTNDSRGSSSESGSQMSTPSCYKELAANLKDQQVKQLEHLSVLIERRNLHTQRMSDWIENKLANALSEDSSVSSAVSSTEYLQSPGLHDVWLSKDPSGTMIEECKAK